MGTEAYTALTAVRKKKKLAAAGALPPQTPVGGQTPWQALKLKARADLAKGGGKTGKRLMCGPTGLKGDYGFESCGAFCKSAKAKNHCKFCKCKSCSFCPYSEVSGGATGSAASIATSEIAVRGVVASPSIAAAPPLPTAKALAAGGGGSPRLQLLAVLCGAFIAAALILWVSVRFFGSGSATELLGRLGLSPVARRLDFSGREVDARSPLVMGDPENEDEPGGGGGKRTSRQVVDAAFRSVEKLEAEEAGVPPRSRRSERKR